MIIENESELTIAFKEIVHTYRESLRIEAEKNKQLHNEIFIREIIIFALQYPSVFERIQSNKQMRQWFPELELFDKE